VGLHYLAWRRWRLPALIHYAPALRAALGNLGDRLFAISSLADLRFREETRTGAGGRRPAPADAAAISACLHRYGGGEHFTPAGRGPDLSHAVSISFLGSVRDCPRHPHGPRCGPADLAGRSATGATGALNELFEQAPHAVALNDHGTDRVIG